MIVIDDDAEVFSAPAQGLPFRCDNGDSHTECPTGASCTCSASVTRTDYICFNAKCVDGIGNCDAWCKAADADRQACF